MTRLQFIGFHPVEIEGLRLKAGDTVGPEGDLDATYRLADQSLRALESRSDFVELDPDTSHPPPPPPAVYTPPPSEAPEPDPED